MKISGSRQVNIRLGPSHTRALEAIVRCQGKTITKVVTDMVVRGLEGELTNKWLDFLSLKGLYDLVPEFHIWDLCQKYLREGQVTLESGHMPAHKDFCRATYYRDNETCVVQFSDGFNFTLKETPFTAECWNDLRRFEGMKHQMESSKHKREQEIFTRSGNFLRVVGND